MSCLWIWAYTDTFGVTLLCHRRLTVSFAGCTRWHHRESGNLLFTLLRMEKFLNVWIAHSAMLGWWQSRVTSLWVIPFFAMHALNAAEHSLSKR